MQRTFTIFSLVSIYCHALLRTADGTAHLNTQASYNGLPVCRDRIGYFHPEDFRVSTCSMCFVYLFPTFPLFKQFLINGTAVLVKAISNDVEVTPIVKSLDSSPYIVTTESGATKKNSNLRSSRNSKQRESYYADQHKRQSFVILRPNVRKEKSIKEICRSLTSSQCRRWQQCCRAANECCDRQMKLTKTHSQDNKLETRSFVFAEDDSVLSSKDNDVDHDDYSQQTNSNSCPMTWDGYSCIPDTQAGVSAYVDCPSFISLYKLSSSASAIRQCLPNATWWKSPESRLEWTDYSGCLPVDFESMKVAQILAIVCNCISIACVVPSLLVFLMLRPLRRQPRIQLHISLFVAMLLSAIFGLLWERLVMYDMLVTTLLHSFVHTHPNSCRFLNMAARLSDTFTFFWMFCQGFHLQWLMIRSFKPFHALSAFSLIGWGVPSLLIITYIIVRLVYYDADPCWIQSTGAFEWIIDGPTMACIVVNLVFLVIILRALWNQLEAHPDDIGPVRRTVRALFFLIPLFGLQQFCIIYRPHVTDTNYIVYDVISAIIVNSQGALVAIMFCFLNEEVQTHVKQSLSRWFAKVKAPHQYQQDPVNATHIQMTAIHRPSVISTALHTD